MGHSPNYALVSLGQGIGVIHLLSVKLLGHPDV